MFFCKKNKLSPAEWPVHVMPQDRYSVEQKAAANQPN